MGDVSRARVAAKAVRRPSEDEGRGADGRAILIRLIPAALLCGSLPSQGLLQHYDLQAAYGPLIAAFRDGDVARWRQLVAQQREWLRARNVWLLLFERGEILVWRNLFRQG